MNTREISAEYRLAHWAHVVQDRNDSGLSIKKYCESAGFHENAYYYWLKKLREAACEGLTNKGGNTTGLAPVGFAEVRLAARTALPPPTSIWENQVSIETDRVRITASSGYPVTSLAELLKEVARP